MARRSGAENLVRLSARLPWWAAIALALAVFAFLTVVVPRLAAENPLVEASLPAFRMLGIVFASLCCVGVLVGFLAQRRQSQLYDRARSIDAVRLLTWRDFERFICEAFRRQGYKARATEPGPDGGVDIRLSRDGQVILVQCKQWRDRRVGVRPVRELAGVVAAERAAAGIFVCSGTYTKEAKEFASGAGIELVGGDRLVEMLNLQSDTAAERTGVDVCPQCGSDLVRRLARRGPRAGVEFMGCSAFPSCGFTRDLEG